METPGEAAVAPWQRWSTYGSYSDDDAAIGFNPLTGLCQPWSQLEPQHFQKRVALFLKGCVSLAFTCGFCGI